jgi:hypothetical protein
VSDATALVSQARQAIRPVRGPRERRPRVSKI